MPFVVVSFQEDTERAAFGRLVGTACAEMDATGFEDFQLECHSLMVRFKRESRKRASQGTQQQVAQQQVAQTPQQHVDIQITDAHLASSIASQQQQQCPQGYLTGWQSCYQPQQPPGERPNSAPAGQPDMQTMFHMS